MKKTASMGLMGMLMAREDGVTHVTYGVGNGDVGAPVGIDTAIDDIDSMCCGSPADVVWYPWPEKGQQSAA
jgi:hypothetical protein